MNTIKDDVPITKPYSFSKANDHS